MESGVSHHFFPFENGRLEDLPGEFPCLRETCAFIAEQQAGAEEAVCRWYQRSLWANLSFAAPSPRTGKAVASGEAIFVDCMGGGSTFFRFPEEPDFLLVAGDLGAGYPIVGAYLPKRGVYLSLSQSPWRASAETLREIDDRLDRPEWRAPRPAESLCLTVGHQNFAHEAWNQWGALETLLSLPRAANLVINASFQSAAPLRQLFPELRAVAMTEVRWKDVPKLNAPGRAAAPIGGFRVSAAVCARLRDLAAARPGERAARLKGRLQGRGPVFWVSVRSGTRVARNQTEAITALGRRIAQFYPKAALVIDGCSLPNDLVDRTPKQIQLITDRVREETEAAESIAKALNPRFPLSRAHSVVVSAVGLSLLDSVYLAGSTHFYFCHHGTVQHKIGWLVGRPGVVHSNAKTLAKRPAAWASEQAPGTPAPIYIPESLVRDEEEPDGASDWKASLHHENYAFTDISALVDFVMREAEKALA